MFICAICHVSIDGGQSGPAQRSGDAPVSQRAYTERDVEFLGASGSRSWQRRGYLFRAVCNAWQWRQQNGELSLYACSDSLSRLEERAPSFQAGLLTVSARPAALVQ